MFNKKDRAAEAARYWNTMQASAADLPFADRKAELEMLALHCESDVLRRICQHTLNDVGRRPVRQRLSEIRA